MHVKNSYVYFSQVAGACLRHQETGHHVCCGGWQDQRGRPERRNRSLWRFGMSAVCFYCLFSLIVFSLLFPMFLFFLVIFITCCFILFYSLWPVSLYLCQLHFLLAVCSCACFAETVPFLEITHSFPLSCYSVCPDFHFHYLFQPCLHTFSLSFCLASFSNIPFRLFSCCFHSLLPLPLLSLPLLSVVSPFMSVKWKMVEQVLHCVNKGPSLVIIIL